MFVPKGCVLLTAAVDRLAEARRAAGQANDDDKHAAQLELMGEFYSGSMLATVICPRSGKTHTIRPDRWALPEALTWFEQGECWLTEYLVDPPLGMLYGKERVTIFVSEHELQRLAAKQEVKQEAVPPHDPLPPPKAASEADAEAKEKNKGGRPQEHNWDAVKSYALALIREHGLPGPGNRKFPNKTQLVEGIVSEWAFRGMTLAGPSVRRYVDRWLKEL